MNAYRHIYCSRTWRKLRLDRIIAEPLCRICAKAGRVTPAREVDHVIPLADGGEPFEFSNTQSLCTSCHSRKTAQDQGHNVQWGCDINGNPLNDKHHWSAKGEGEVARWPLPCC